jgi:hypothetical protein
MAVVDPRALAQKPTVKALSDLARLADIVRTLCEHPYFPDWSKWTMADEQPAPPPTDWGVSDSGGPANRSQPGVPAPRTMPVGPIVTLAGAGVIAVGSVLPWFTLSGPRHVFGTASISGTRFNGQITLILAVLIGLGAAVLWWHRAHREEAVRLLIGALAFSVIMIGLANLVRDDGGAFADYPAQAYAYVGPGLYLVMVGGLAALIGGQILPRKSS